METTLEQLDSGRVRLTVEVPSGEIKHAVDHAAHDLSARVKIPGFRAGKVPQNIMLQRIGKERLYSEAIDSHLSNWFWIAARRTRVRPSELPDFTYDLPESDSAEWVFKAEFPVQGPIEPADWKKLEVPKLEIDVDPELVEAQIGALQEMVAALTPVEGRPPRKGDVAVVDILSDEGPGQKNYVIEIGTDRLVEELDDAIRHLFPGESERVSWQVDERTQRFATVSLKELHEKVLPPQDDELAKAASEFDTLDDLRKDTEVRVREMLDEEVERRFRTSTVDELIKATNVKPAALVIEVRTRELINAFIRQIESRGMSASAYLQAMGVTGAELEQRLRAEAENGVTRELVLEGAADKLKIKVTDDDIRKELKDEGEDEAEIEEFMKSGATDRARDDLRLKRALDKIVSEVKPISQELASARESIWTPGKEEGDGPGKKLWTPGS